PHPPSALSTLSLHDALPIFCPRPRAEPQQPVEPPERYRRRRGRAGGNPRGGGDPPPTGAGQPGALCPRSRAEPQQPVASSERCRDRKSTRLNSSHVAISYAV